MKKQILILDDDASVRESVCKVLAGSGYQVVLAPDGKSGLAQLRRQSFDLLLLDLDLPDLTGFDILDSIRERAPWLPVIILTGVAEQCAPGSLLGAAALLHKPADVLLLLQTVESLLKQTPGDHWHGPPEDASGLTGEPVLKAGSFGTGLRSNPRRHQRYLPKHTRP